MRFLARPDVSRGTALGALVVLILLLGGCGPSAQQRLREARALRASWDLVGAARLVVPLARDTTLADSARLQVGEILHARGDLPLARDVLASLAARPGPQRAEARWLLAHTYFLLGQPDSSRAVSQALSQAAAGRAPLRQARAHHVLGLVAFYEAAYDVALRHQRESLRLAREARDLRAEADALRQLGVLYWYRGAIDSAQTTFYEPALTLYRQVADRIGEATTLSNIGLLYWERGDWRENARLQLQAFELRRRIGDQVGLADSYYFLSDIPRYVGFRTPVYTSTYLTKSAELSERIGYAWGLQVARRRLRWHLMQTLSYDHPAHERWRAASAATSGEEQFLSTYTAAVWADRGGRWREALARYETASRMADSLAYHNYRVSIMARRIRIALRLGRLEAAEALLAQAAPLVAREARPAWKSRIEGMRAELHLRRGEPHAAVRRLRPLATRYDSLYLATLAEAHPGQHYEQAAGAVHGRRSTLYGLLIEALHHHDPSTAFTYLERERSLPFWGDRGAPPEDERATVGRFVRLLEEAEAEPSRGADVQALLTALGEMHQTMLAQQRTLAAVAPSPEHLTVTTLPATRQALRDDEVLVEYFVGRETLWLLAVRRDTTRWLSIPVGEDDVLATVRMLRRTLRRGAGDPQDTFWQPSARRLHAWLIAPLTAHGLLHEGDALLLAPHRMLHGVPFQALPVSKEEMPPRFLVEQHAITYVPSATALVEDRRMPVARPASWVGVAPAADALPHARREVRQAAARWQGPAEVRVGAEARAGAVLRALQEADAVHVAAHARMNDRFPLYAHIALHDRRLELHEILRRQVAARLVVLSACETGRSVGAAGDVPTGADLVSFPRAFLEAGAASVIATQWRVDDASTARLMAALYAHLATTPAPDATLRPAAQAQSSFPPLARALSQAQRREITEARRNGEQPHPFYWAGVFLTGDGR